MSIQVMAFEQAEKWQFDPFDLTKVPHIHTHTHHTFGTYTVHIFHHMLIGVASQGVSTDPDG